MADAWDIIAGNDPEANAKAMAAALRGKRAMGELALLSGNPVLKDLGESQLKTAEFGEQQLGEALKGRLERTFQTAAAQRAQAELELQGRNAERAQKNTEYEQQMQRERFEAEEANRRFERGMAGAHLQLQAGTQKAEIEKMGRLPPEAIEKDALLTGSAKAIDEAEHQFNENPTAYLAGHEAHGAAIAKGLFSKEMPNAAQAAAEMLPGKALMAGVHAGEPMSKKIAAEKFQALREKIQGQRDELRKSYGAAGYSAPAPTGSAGKVDVISPDGKRGRIPADKLEDAMKRGFKRG